MPQTNSSPSATHPPLEPSPQSDLPILIVAKDRALLFEMLGRTTLQLELVDSKGTVYEAAKVADGRVGATQPAGIPLMALPLGPKVQRALVAIHERVLRSQSTVAVFSDRHLARLISGPQLNRHWRSELRQLLSKMGTLAVQESATNSRGFQRLFASIVHHPLRATGQVACTPNCPSYRREPHGHTIVTITPAFLGSLSACVTAENPSVVDLSTKTLTELGRKNLLRPLFLPAVLGDPSACRQLSPSQHRLLSGLLREGTRARKTRRKSWNELMVFEGNRIKAFSGKALQSCDLLAPDGQYVGFNGNGLPERKGHGYRLLTPGGWLAKCGYDSDGVERFMADLEDLASKLGLIVVGVASPNSTWLSISQLLTLSRTPMGRTQLNRLHLRLYATADFLERWCTFFGWHPVQDRLADVEESDEHLAARVRQTGVRNIDLARRLDQDPSFLAKVMKGIKPMPNSLRENLLQLLPQLQREGERLARERQRWLRDQNDPQILATQALRYHEMGLNVIPVVPGTKKPCVKWKQYQAQRVSREEVEQWWREHPAANIGVILGPVSNLFAIDADGKEAALALSRVLDAGFPAPKSQSGSGDPNRFHLFFQHPGFKTRARVTPLHPKLEFRGSGGLLVLPPSIHPSGNRYTFVAGRELGLMPLTQLPDNLLTILCSTASSAARKPVAPPAAKLQATRARPPARATGETKSQLATRASESAVNATARPEPPVRELAQSTKDFLAGKYADSDGEWNNRMFQAACDLKACGSDLNCTLYAVTRAAKPRTPEDAKQVTATVLSAYSQPRTPSRR